MVGSAEVGAALGEIEGFGDGTWEGALVVGAFDGAFVAHKAYV